jgi:hypothetical protein
VRPIRLRFLLAALAAAIAFDAVWAQAPAARVDAAFEHFWAARSPSEAARLIGAIVESGVGFDDALRRLKTGRPYGAQKTGVVKLTNRTEDGVEHHYALNIPAGYDPARRYSVRFQLHGGVMARSDNQPRNSGEIGALAGAEQIYVIPYSWSEAPWWSEDQVLNVGAILDSLKRAYNLDENRVVVSGVSDGATGAYYIAMRETTPFASFLSLNGFIMVLAGPDTGIREDLFPNNLRNKPMFVVNGGRDRLYPIVAVEPYVLHLKKSGVDTEYHPRPDGEHNTAWWPDVKDTFEGFVARHPRNPLPDRLTWETSDLSRNRAHWLVIDKLGAQADDAKELADANDFSPIEVMAIPIFRWQAKPGRVDLVKTGNTVNAVTRGVSVFTLLLSPDLFDFAQPVRVTVNGKTRFNGRVEPSLATLLKWAARDNDRTMLFAAELHIKP